MFKRVITRYLFHYLWILLIAVVLSIIVSDTFVQGNKIISSVINDTLAENNVLFGSLAIRFLAFTVIGGGAAFLQSILTSKYAVLVCTKYKDYIVEKLYRIEYKYFDSNYSATLLNKVIGDLGEISTLLETVLPDMLRNVIAIMIYSIYIGEMNLGLLIIIYISYPLIFGIANILIKKIGRLQAIYRQKTDVMAETAQEAVNGIVVLRSFGLEDVFRKRMKQAAAELVENEEKRTRITNTALVAGQIIRWIPNIICAVYAVYLVSRGEISLGGLVAFILILDKFVEAFIGLPFAIVDATAGLVSIKRIEDILKAEEEPQGDELKVPDSESVISFKNVNFGYTEDAPVLRNLSFDVKKGENVAFVGESGGGKSTIFHILCGFYESSSGQYELFGRDIKKWNKKKLREQIALVSQNIFLFPVTILENISYAKPEATQEEIVEACKKAQIHEFIMTLPQAYQTLAGERGTILSGGQKQRISIARAILKDAPILLMDEPTSALDVETESCIQDAINAVMSGRTCITIAHRLSTIIHADRIMVLKYGQIVESGTHKELMSLGQVYAKMYGEETNERKL